jgi:hypothetical protein
MPSTPSTWKSILRLFLVGVHARALNACTPRSASTIQVKAADLSRLILVARDKGEVYRELTMLRVDDGWPADLAGWTWWERQLESMQNMLLGETR